MRLAAKTSKLENIPQCHITSLSPESFRSELGRSSTRPQREVRSPLPTLTSMSQDKYEFCVTLTGHSGTITALQFSPDCKFLASGSNHGVLLIFSTFSWRPVKRLIDASSITTLVWHDTERYLLLCGCESGDLHFLKFTKSLVRPPLRDLT